MLGQLTQLTALILIYKLAINYSVEKKAEKGVFKHTLKVERVKIKQHAAGKSEKGSHGLRLHFC